MISKRFKIRLLKLCLRFILFSVITYIVYDYGMNIRYSLTTAFVFMIFWSWLMWYDYKVNPIIRWDELND